MSLRILYIVGCAWWLLSCKNQNTEGVRLYQQHCLQCHQEGGKGVGKLIPPISGTYLREHAEELPCLLRRGKKGVIDVDDERYDHEMPGNQKLTSVDIVNLLNYLEETYGSGATQHYNIEQVERALEGCR